MIQILRIGDGLLLAINENVHPSRIEEMSKRWREIMPDVRAAFIANATIVSLPDNDGHLIEFRGDLTRRAYDEIRAWLDQVEPRSDPPEGPGDTIA